jgi:type II secretory pathway pseudopilin PulG
VSRLASQEGGFTLIEAVIAVLLLVVSVIAISTLFLTGNDSSLAVQRQNQAISVAQQQIEKIRAEVKTDGFDALAMSSAPVAMASPPATYASTIEPDPFDFVEPSSGCGSSGEEYVIESNFDNTAEGPPVNPENTSSLGLDPWYDCTDSAAQVGEPLEILSGGFVTPQQTGVPVGTDTATVDTFVTDTYVGCSSTVGGCPAVNTSTGLVGSAASPCSWPSSTSASTTCADARRVIVAVILNDHGRYDTGPSAPIYVSTVFTNPVPSNQPSSSIGLSVGAQLG